MLCQDTKACFEEVRTYCNNIPTGFPLLVDTEDYDDFHQLITWLRSDPSKHFIYVSDFCAEDGLPRTQEAYAKAFEPRDNVLVGLSQACMLQSGRALDELLDALIDEKTIGHTVVLLMHCREYLLKRCGIDCRLNRRIVFLEGNMMPLPQISIVRDKNDYADGKLPQNIQQFLVSLEQMTNEKIEESLEFHLLTLFPASLFQHSVYSIKQGPGIYERLCQEYADIADATEETYGTEEQWRCLKKELNNTHSFSELITMRFHSYDSLDLRLGEILTEGSEQEKWLYWLALKVHKTHNHYFNEAVQSTRHYMELEFAIYFTLLDMSKNSSEFSISYKDRKSLLKRLPQNIKLISQYCNEVGKKDVDAVYFLTDMSEPEQFKLIQCLSQYSYDQNVIKEILQAVSPELSKYMRHFEFTSINTQLADNELVDKITQYFDDYKWQKLSNYINDDFLYQVEKIAEERPYNKLLTRTAVIKNMDCRQAQPYFIDALGVEYLSYIAEKCKEYGLLSEVHIGHADLPSITEINKDFESSFDLPYNNIKDLDELKHSSNRFNYEKVKEPMHLVSELKVIDDVLKHIQSDLLQGLIERAVIVSDHGASRLSVIHEQENKSTIEMSEKGKHGGRCCKLNVDPQIPFAAYENGYAVLANYDRFKGSRKADVEVHGGATLEEVLVPVIGLTLKPDKLNYSFVDPVIFIKHKKENTLILFCNMPMTKPKLCIQNKFYEGEFTTADQQHAKFVLDDIHRKNKYKAEVYEDDISTGIILDFEIKKQTHEVDFGF